MRFHITKNSCVSIHDLNTNKRVVLYNYSPREKSQRKFIHGPFINLIPLDGKNYYDVTTGERIINQESVARSTRRARTAIIDLALVNEFTHFGTLTLDGSRHNVADIEGCLKSMLDALKYYRQLSPSFRYIVVPEYGEKFKRLHFHFLMKGIRPKDLFKNKYHHLDFKYFKERFGHVQITAIPQNRADIERTAKYCGKYITKDNIQIRSHRYFRSLDLKKHTKYIREIPMLAYWIREALKKYTETCYYDKECECYDLPTPLYNMLKQAIMEQYCASCYIQGHLQPKRWRSYELP